MSNDLVIPMGVEHQFEQVSNSQPPRAVLLQSTSAKVKDGTFKPGTIIHSITEEVLSDKVIPLLHFVTYVRFNASKSTQRGWDGSRPPLSLIYKFRSVLEVPAGEMDWETDSSGKQTIPPLCNITDNILCYVRGQMMPVLYSFSKSAKKVGEKFLDKYRSFPALSKMFSVTSEQNKNEIFIPKIEIVNDINQNDIDTAYKMFKMYKSKIDEVAQDNDELHNDEEIPF